MNRDDFPAAVRDSLAKRVALRCSNPDCRQPTHGPHSSEHKAVNLGVASHITAASPNGPRFDAALTREQRAGIENAIWLCQTCARLIDSDETRFSVALLRGWKLEAEYAAREALEMRIERSAAVLACAGSSSPHSPIPVLMGRTYHEARQMLIDVGWQPRSRHWSHRSDPSVMAGIAFWDLGYWEIINAWGTGSGMCTFAFHDVYGNFLTVQTAGEEDEASGWHARVTNWYLTDSENVPLGLRQS